MLSIPIELQRQIIYFSFRRHILFYVCKSWQQIIINNPSTSTLMEDINNIDLYAIKYKYHHDNEEFDDKIIDRVIEINNDELTKVFIDIYHINWEPKHNATTAEAKFLRFVLNSGRYNDYIKKKSDCLQRPSDLISILVLLLNWERRLNNEKRVRPTGQRFFIHY